MFTFRRTLRVLLPGSGFPNHALPIIVMGLALCLSGCDENDSTGSGSPGTVDDCFDYASIPRRLGSIPTPVFRFAVDAADRFYAASGDLVILDAADPADVQELGRLPLVGATGVALDGRIAYVATSEAGLLVVDVGNPLRPAEIARVEADRLWNVTTGPGVVVAWEIGPSVHVYDRRGSMIPELVATLDIGERVRDLVVSGDRLYVAAGPLGLRIYDISDPTSPRELDGLDAVFGQHVAVGDGIIAIVSNAVELYRERRSGPPDFLGVFPRDDAWVFNTSALHGNRLLIGARDETLIVDISDPADPRLLSRITGSFRGLLAVRNGRIYAGDSEVTITEFGDGPTPRPAVAPVVSLTDVSVVGDLAVAATADRLHTIDLSDRAEPLPRGEVVLGSDPSGPPRYVALGSGLAYTTAIGADLDIVNVEDPDAPAIVGSVPILSSGVADLAMAGRWICVAALSEGLEVFTATDPTSPVSLGVVSLPSTAVAVEISGDIAYVGQGDRLSAVRLDPSGAHEVLGEVSIPVPGLAVEGSHAYVPARELTIIDISQPAAMRTVAEFPFPGPGGLREVSVRNGMAVLVGDGDMMLVDVSRPERPELVAITPPLTGSSGATHVLASDDVIAAVNPGRGLEVWPIPCR